MTSVILSFELHLKSAFDTTGILAVLLLSFILLLAWKYRKSKQLIRYGRFKLFLQKDGRKPLPEENEECNCNQMTSIGSSVSLQEIGIDNKSQQSILLQKGDRKSVPEENEDNCTQIASGRSVVVVSSL